MILSQPDVSVWHKDCALARRADGSLLSLKAFRMYKFAIIVSSLFFASVGGAQEGSLSPPGGVTIELLNTGSSSAKGSADGMRNLASDGREDNNFPQAFPGAMGGGKYASGGRGGKVVVVNTRENDCDGSNSLVSLNEALSMSGPRYVIFAVDGIVELAGCGSVKPSSMKTFYMLQKNSNVTVACQTAPGKMVIRVSALNHSDGMSNAIYRHCAFRGARITGGGARGNQRAVGIFPNRNMDSTDFIFDHNTFSWTDDDVFQIYISPTATGSARNVTVQHSIAAEGDSDSAADTSSGCHSGSGSSCKTRGQSWDAQAGGMNALGISTQGYRAENITFTHNFQAHNALRNCEFKGHVIAECSNNITYNWRTYGAIWQAGYRPVPTQIRGVNNLFVRGPETTESHGAKSSECRLESGKGTCPIFINRPSDGSSGVKVYNNYLQDSIGSSPSSGALLQAHPLQDVGTFTADSLLTSVSENRDIRQLARKDSTHINCIGASRPVRHRADQRVIDEMFSGTGKIGIGEDIRSNNGVVNATTHDTVIQRDWSEFNGAHLRLSSFDTDADGISDAWEIQNGLKVGELDHNGDLDGDGYTNIEEYLNDLARCF